jgi:ribokinase
MGVLVAGSINMDIVATAARFPAVGETVSGSDVRFFPGGKGANQAVAAAKSGAPTALIGRLGEDAFAQELKDFLTGQGVDLRHVAVTAGASTGVALITVHDADNTIVVIPGANGLVTPADVGVPAINAGDVLVSQFEIPLATIAAFFSRGRAAGARTILNPAPMVAFDPALLDLVDILVLNETELGMLAHITVGDADPPDRIAEVARSVRRDDQVICVTLGRRGAVALVEGDMIVIPARVVTAVDTTGAGDCFVGALAARLSAGVALRDALTYANVAASICVQRHGAGPSMPTAGEVTAATRAIYTP